MSGRPQYYVSECPETKQQFLVEHGVDGNIVELTMENVRVIKAAATAVPNTSGKHRRKDDLLAFLLEQAQHYEASILPMYPSDDEPDSVLTDFAEYDGAKNEFFESVWDVIHQHFIDAGQV